MCYFSSHILFHHDLTPIAFIMWRSWNFSDSLDDSIIGQFGDFIGEVVGTLRLLLLHFYIMWL